MPVSLITVLVVDDNDASAKTMGWTVELLGCKALTAKDGKTALAVAKAQKPNIIMLDIGLPDIDGYSVCRELKRDPELAHTIIIAQTGWGESKHIRQSKEAGFDHHLTKPVEIEKLKSIIHSVSALQHYEAERIAS